MALGAQNLTLGGTDHVFGVGCRALGGLREGVGCVRSPRGGDSEVEWRWVWAAVGSSRGRLADVDGEGWAELRGG